MRAAASRDDDDRSPRAVATDATRRVPRGAAVRDRRRPARRALALTARGAATSWCASSRPRGAARRSSCSTPAPGRVPRRGSDDDRPAVDVDFERAVEAAASIVTCLQRRRRPVECTTSAGVPAHAARPTRDPPCSTASPPSPPAIPTSSARCSRGCVAAHRELVIFVTAGLDDPRRRRPPCVPNRAVAVLVVSSGGDLAPRNLRVVVDASTPFPTHGQRRQHPYPRSPHLGMDLRRTLAPTCALAALSAAVAAGFAPRHRSVTRGSRRSSARPSRRTRSALCTRRRSIGASMSLTLAGLAAYVLWVLLPHTTALGVPTGRTLDALSHRLDAGLLALRNDTAPVAPRPGAILLAVLADMGDGRDGPTTSRSAGTRRSAALAPGITLFIWIAALAPTSDSPVGAAVAMVITGAGFLALQTPAVLDAPTRRVRVGCGRERDAARAAPDLRRARARLGRRRHRGCARAGAPRRGAPTHFVDLRNDDRGSSTYQTSVPPLIDVADSLRRGELVEVFTVPPRRRSTGAPSRSTTTPTTAAANGRSRAAGGDITPRPPRGADGADRDAEVPASAGSASGGCRPRSTRVGEPRRHARRRVSRTLVTNEDAVQGLRYRVVSQPPPVELNEAQRRATARPCRRASSKYTEVPESLPDAVGPDRATANRGRSDAVRPGRVLRDYFRGPQLHLRPRRRPHRRRQRRDRVPRHEARLLRAVREHVRAHGPHARHPGARRGRLHARCAGRDHRPLSGDQLRRARLARDLARRRGLDEPVRPDAAELLAGREQPAEGHLPRRRDADPATVHHTDDALDVTARIHADEHRARARSGPGPGPVGATESGRSWTTPVLWALFVGVLVAMVDRGGSAREARTPAHGGSAEPIRAAASRARGKRRSTACASWEGPRRARTTPAEHARAATATVGESARASARGGRRRTHGRPVRDRGTDRRRRRRRLAGPRRVHGRARPPPAAHHTSAAPGCGSGRCVGRATRRDLLDPRDDQLEAVAASAVRSSSTND